MTEDTGGNAATSEDFQESDLETILRQQGWTIETTPFASVAERVGCETGEEWSVVKGPVRVVSGNAAGLVSLVREIEESRPMEPIAPPPPEPPVADETQLKLAPELLGPIPIGFGDITDHVPPPRKRRARRIDLPVHNEPRPLTRADCIDGPRPCPWVGCKYHLLIDVKDKGGMVVNFDGGLRTISTRRAIDEEWMDSAVDRLETMKHTCALDVADLGEHTLEEVGELYGLTRERIRQMVDVSLESLKESMTKLR